MRKGLLLGLSLWMLMSGAAAENTVEILPTAAPMPEPVLEENPYAFEDLSAYYEEGWDEYQSPGLTDTEISRYADAQRRWEQGERPEESILNRTENVKIALLQVPADQYEGENWFLLLPGWEMTDDELLQLADAFGQLGATLDPGMVSWHNCMRGGGIEYAVRPLREDERERLRSISGLFIRGGLRPETPFTDLVMDDGLGRVTLDEEAFNGLDVYTFYPARRMTDEELLQLYAMQNPEPAAESDEMARYEGQIRQELHDLLGMPLSASRWSEESVRTIGDGNAFGDERTGYYTAFTEVGGTGRRWSGAIDISTGRLVWAEVTLDDRYYTDPAMISDVLMDPWDARWNGIARTAVTELRKDQGAGIAETVTWCEAGLNDLLASEVRVITEDGSVYIVRISYVFEEVMEIEYQDAVSMMLEDQFYYSMEAKEGIVNE